MDKEKCRKLYYLAKDLAAKGTDKGLNQAIEILTGAIDQGCEDPKILVTAATLLLQSSQATNPGVRKKAVELTDKAVGLSPENISILEEATSCYELTLEDFPQKLEDILKLYLKMLDLNPDHIDAMLTLAYHREHPCVRLSLDDTIRMLEWAKEIEPGNHFVAFSLARLYAETGRIPEATALYEQINSGQSDSPNLMDTDITKPSNAKSKRIRHRKLSRN